MSHPWHTLIPWLLMAGLGIVITVDIIVQTAKQRKAKQQLNAETPTAPGPHPQNATTQQPIKPTASPDAAGI